MKNIQSLVCTGILVIAMSASAFGKSGIISTTKTGIIPTTSTGTISTTRTGTISTTTVGTIPTTRTGIISTSSSTTVDSFGRFSLIDLLFSLFSPW